MLTYLFSKGVFQLMPDYLTFLNYLALFMVIFVFISFFYGIVLLCDVPYKIAKKRNHPQQDAIQVAGWVSLFTLQIIWPFLWIWATLYREDKGLEIKTSADNTEKHVENEPIDNNSGVVS